MDCLALLHDEPTEALWGVVAIVCAMLCMMQAETGARLQKVQREAQDLRSLNEQVQHCQPQTLRNQQCAQAWDVGPK